MKPELKNVTISGIKTEDKISAKGKPFVNYKIKANEMLFDVSQYNVSRDINITNENGEILSLGKFLAIYSDKEFIADIVYEFLLKEYNGEKRTKYEITGVHITPTF